MPGLSLERARLLLNDGRVRIRGKVCQATRRLWGGEEIVVDLPPPAGAPAVVEGPPVPVLYEDSDLLIIDKPAGLIVDLEGASALGPLLAARHQGFDVDGRALPGLVHRLDRETSGCLAFAKNDAAVIAIKAAFEHKQIDKRYRALVLGEPPERARLEGPYARDPNDKRRYTTRLESARRAALSYEVMERYPGAALVEIKLETGRTHQIRVQLSEAGFPVLADSIYGPNETRTHPAAKIAGRHALHAVSLSLPHPRTGERIAVAAPWPAELARAAEALKSRAI